MSEVLDNLRILNVALCLLAALGLWVRVNDYWRRLPRSARVLAVGVIGFPLFGAYGSLEAFLQHATPGPRTVVLAAVCVITLLGVWMTGRCPPPGLIAARDVLAVVDGVEGAEADRGGGCVDPGCIAARIQLRKLATT